MDHFNPTEKSETFFDPEATVTLLRESNTRKQTDRLRLIYSGEPLTLSSYFFITLIMTIMAWPHANQYILSAWFITTTIVLSLRFLLILSFNSKLTNNIRPQKWHLRFIILNILSGISIGACGLLSLSPEQYLLPIILTVGLISLSSISVSTLSIEKNLFPGFMIPALLPVTINTLMSGDNINSSISLLIIIFSITILLISKHNRENIDKTFIIRYENSHLLEDLITSKKQLEFKNQELEKLAIEDYLTGLANRRYGDAHLQSEWNKAIRYKRPISVIMIDIDKFKSYNDHYGHQMGDDCLKITAQALKQSLSRPADLPVRYGGEEFIIILPDTDSAGALSIANRFQSVLNKITIPHDFSDVANHITVSCGISSMTPKRNDNISSLVQHADIAMYKAKFNGGNQSLVFKSH